MAMPPPVAATASKANPAPGASPVKVPHTIAPAKAGRVKYKDRRLLVMFFDRAGMPVADQIRAQQAALKFVRSQITAADLVAVMVYTTDLDVLQDFTADRDALTKAIQSLTAFDNGMANRRTGDDSETDTAAAHTAH